ncbi:ribonuclease catalytic domain-containing protein, partial [Desulfovibrio sp. OttesenSCG-928-G11]|nr:ribonuclease catalytic domain-containing protein [Desulfovibrio sp. OttesenSCG-928-G11]
LVEFMQGNSPVQAVVLEEQGDRLRVYAINRRESKIAASRLLPWSGPSLGGGAGGAGSRLSRQSMDEAMEERRALRASIAAGISTLEVWELTQGEVGKATAEWLAGLIWELPSIDQVAALGHALLGARTHFRFSPPDFEIFSEEMVEARRVEAENLRMREAFAVTGAQFFQKLRDVAMRKRGPLEDWEEPEPELALRLKALIRERIADPDSTEDAALWKMLVKSLPESPHQALILATAWNLVPEHYNFYLDRIAFARGEDWLLPFAGEADELRRQYGPALAALEPDASCYVSIDPADTKDRDDAFYVERNPDGGFKARLALACPALVWPFGGPLDKEVFRRASSLYLPEGDLHMLPENIGRGLFSLDEGETRPALTLELELSPEGEVLESRVALRAVSGTLNMNLAGAEAALNAGAAGADAAAATAAASSVAAMLGRALDLARLLQERRIASGAVITERPDPEIIVDNVAGECRVRIEKGVQAPLAHLLVGEMMILCNSALSAWAQERELPLLYRSQDVALPKEFAGIWTRPQDISRVVRALPPASLEAAPRRHAGLGLAFYSTMSSPIRRYADLLNQGQVAAFLRRGAPLFDKEQLAALLPALSARAEAVGQVQRLRPRYWKLVFFRAHGDRVWWDGVVAEENEAFASISLPWAHLLVRGKRRRLGEKLYPGMDVQVRLGKIDPLLGEIQVLETREI